MVRFVCGICLRSRPYSECRRTLVSSEASFATTPEPRSIRAAMIKQSKDTDSQWI